LSLPCFAICGEFFSKFADDAAGDEAGELFVGASLEATYGLLDATFAGL